MTFSEYNREFCRDRAEILGDLMQTHHPTNSRSVTYNSYQIRMVTNATMSDAECKRYAKYMDMEFYSKTTTGKIHPINTIIFQIL